MTGFMALSSDEPSSRTLYKRSNAGIAPKSADRHIFERNLSILRASSQADQVHNFYPFSFQPQGTSAAAYQTLHIAAPGFFRIPELGLKRAKSAICCYAPSGWTIEF
jgi:hypothetical protein